MKISTKGRYALRIMIDIAKQDREKYVSIQEISARQDISVKYSEMIVGILNRAGFLISQRGKNGGYKLVKEPFEYTAGAILKLTEGDLAPVSCLSTKTNSCVRADECSTLKFWQGLNNVIETYVESVTLQDLIKTYDAENNFII